MLIEGSPLKVQKTVRSWKRSSTIAIVPTMGCLHAGHLELVRHARQLADKCVVSIFVNPLQFGPHEDFDKYPRPFEEDVAKLRALNVDLLFHPAPEEFYPVGFVSRMRVEKLSEFLEGRSRPGHFEGVTTVCLKLFQVSQADFAVFGEKDFQQLRVLQKMVEDLNLPLEIVPHATVRETDGLALSSRNRYLSAEERRWAAQFPQALRQAQSQLRERPRASVGELLQAARSILAAAPVAVDYLEIASARDLVPVSPETPVQSLAEPRILAAVKVGKTRLIDNMPLGSGA